MAAEEDTEGWKRTITAFNHADVEPQVRTIVCPLQTSRRKIERAEEAIGEWQQIASQAAQLLPSFGPWQWKLNNTQITRAVSGELPDRNITQAAAQQAIRHVIGAFKSWDAEGRKGDSPQGRWGYANYMDLPARCVDIVENDAGYGVRLRFEPKHARDGDGHVWYRINTEQYHEHWLERIVSERDDTSHGAATLRVSDDGQATLALSVKTTPSVLEPGAVGTWVGVDIGENRLYALAACDAQSGAVERVEVKSGREYRHHRQQLKHKRNRRQEKGDKQGARDCGGDIEKYTEHVLHTASREIVEIAEEYEKTGIRLESLSGYQASEEYPISDWPYSKLRNFIEYKARAAGIPTDIHGSWFTSSLCNKCGEYSKQSPWADHFHCEDCDGWDGDYEINSDVNAAINIARRATPPVWLMQHGLGEW